MTDEETKARLKEQAESDARFFRNNRPGGWLWETVVVVALAAVFFLYCFPPCIPARQQSREAEAKAGLHAIQVALERYATDKHTYPPFLYGGDVFSTFTTDRSNLDPREFGAGGGVDFSNYNGDPRAIPGDCDALLQYGYLSRYPSNPFVRRRREGETGILISDPRDATRTRIETERISWAPMPRAGCIDSGPVNGWWYALPRVPGGEWGNLMWDVSEGQRHPPYMVLDPGERAGSYYLPPVGTDGVKKTADLHDDTDAAGTTVNESKNTMLHPHLPGNFYYYHVDPAPGNWNLYYHGASSGTQDMATYRLAVYGPPEKPGLDLYDMFGDFEDRMIGGIIDNANVPEAEVGNLGGPDGRPDGILWEVDSGSDVILPEEQGGKAD